jgi:hypothetical protein
VFKNEQIFSFRILVKHLTLENKKITIIHNYNMIYSVAMKSTNATRVSVYRKLNAADSFMTLVARSQVYKEHLF